MSSLKTRTNPATDQKVKRGKVRLLQSSSIRGRLGIWPVRGHWLISSTRLCSYGLTTWFNKAWLPSFHNRTIPSSISLSPITHNQLSEAFYSILMPDSWVVNAYTPSLRPWLDQWSVNLTWFHFLSKTFTSSNIAVLRRHYDKHCAFKNFCSPCGSITSQHQIRTFEVYIVGGTRERHCSWRFFSTFR